MHLRLASRPAVQHPTDGLARDILLVRLTSDGRVAAERTFGDLIERASAATDCFVFCHGWLHDEREARREAARFFGRLETALGPARGRVRPLRVALHWPSKPFAPSDPAARPATPDAFFAAHVPLGPEEEYELDTLRARHAASHRGASAGLAFHAFSFWTMKRRAGDVGERFAREWLAPIWSGLRVAPRLHLIGHSFGAKLVTSMVLGGMRPDSVSLPLGAFSAFAFAREIPGAARPGFYHRVVAERLVQGRIAVLRSDHDTALTSVYRALSGSTEIGRTPRRAATGRRGQSAEIVATSALGAVGARGIGAPEVDLVEAQRIGLPSFVVVNVDGSRLIRRTEPIVGAHRDIDHTEVSRMVLLAAGVLEPGPDGLRVPGFDQRLRSRR